MCERLCTVTDSPKGNGGESSSLDEDSSDALSPDQLTNQDSPLSAVPQVSPSDVLTQNGDLSPTQVLLRWNRKNWTEQLVKQKQDHAINHSDIISPVSHTASCSTSTTTSAAPSLVEWVRFVPST